MEKLPENWNEMSHLEKSRFFARNYVRYTREGETDGIWDWAPDEIKKAYEEFLKDEEKD